MKELQEAIDRLLEVAKKIRDTAPSSPRPTRSSTHSEQQRAPVAPQEKKD